MSSEHPMESQQTPQHDVQEQEYEAPNVEQVLTSDTLSRQIQYAGDLSIQ